MEELPNRPTVCFYGHTHRWDVHRARGNAIAQERAEDIPIAREQRYLINPGAVGQPRDEDPRASFLIYDAKARNVTLYRTAYDITACQTKIIRAGLPAWLAQRLSMGT